MTVNVTQSDFEQVVVQSDVPVVLEFFAPWCAYCKRLAPALTRLDKKYDGAIKFAKVNIDEQPQLATEYGADTIPTLYLYKNGKHGDKIVAPDSQPKLEQWLNAQLNK